MPTLVDFQNYLAKLITELLHIWDFLTHTINYSLQPLAMSFPPFMIVYVALDNIGLGDLTFLELILGSGLYLYIGYQFFIWLFNLIT